MQTQVVPPDFSRTSLQTYKINLDFSIVLKLLAKTKMKDWKYPEKESEFVNASGRGLSESDAYKKRMKQNIHPTVKNTKLMSYLINLITPPNGLVLDPFMGSGSTGTSAIREGFKFIGIEKELDYFNIAHRRITHEEDKKNEQSTIST